MPARKELPSTVRRSSKKMRRTWAAAHDSAVETYGEGRRAHRTAFAALKHSHEKVGRVTRPAGTAASTSATDSWSRPGSARVPNGSAAWPVHSGRC
ncbi:MAG: hypothetical protein GEV28_16450 [Actinophytocola sp.]|nr:hypothetical protein [Actinophytocola sp.]